MRIYDFGMPEEVGDGFDAARAREVALTEHIKASAETDRVAAATMRNAYEAALRGRVQLDRIASDIENVVRNQQAFALDTPAGARSFANFLGVKREGIADVLREATRESREKSALVQSLGPDYRSKPWRTNAQLAGFDNLKDTPGMPLPESPWEYNLDFTSNVEAHGFGWPGVRSAGQVTSINDAWDELNRCFNCNFPMGGAPVAFPRVGDKLPLEIRIAGQKLPIHFPVEVTQVQKTPNEINIEFATLPGHVDGVGSTIHFRFYQQGGELHLGIRGYIDNGPGSQGLPFGPALRGGYTEVAKAVWQPYIDRVTRHVAQSKGLLTYGGS